MPGISPGCLLFSRRGCFDHEHLISLDDFRPVRKRQSAPNYNDSEVVIRIREMRAITGGEGEIAKWRVNIYASRLALP